MKTIEIIKKREEKLLQQISPLIYARYESADECADAMKITKKHINQTIKEVLESLVGELEERMPTEYLVSEYKTMEARTYDEKQLVIEALQDIKQLLQDIIKEI